MDGIRMLRLDQRRGLGRVVWLCMVSAANMENQGMLRRNAVFRLVAMGFVPLVCMVLVAGCATTQPPECETDADCAEGQVCENGRCVDAPVPECETDADCAEGQVCEDGVCADAPVIECETDADCAEGQVCEDGVCVDAPEEPLHKALITDYQGTQTCLTCHADHAADIMETAHWNWSGAVDDIAGLEGEDHGKVDLVNDY